MMNQQSPFMTRFLPLISLGLTVMMFPQIATAQSVTLDPGLYDVSTNIMMDGTEVFSDETGYCILEGENTKTVEELEAGISGHGDCEMRNVEMTGGIGHADFICTDTDIGFDISGTMEATYGSDFFNVDTNAAIPILGKILAQTKIRRSGNCAATEGESQ